MKEGRKPKYPEKTLDDGLQMTLSQGSYAATAGSMNFDYSTTFTGETSKMNTYTATGISNSILASRISYVFNLHGPCLVVDTACSSSLVAVHQACSAIRNGKFVCLLFYTFL